MHPSHCTLIWHSRITLGHKLNICMFSCWKCNTFFFVIDPILKIAKSHQTAQTFGINFHKTDKFIIGSRPNVVWHDFLLRVRGPTNLCDVSLTPTNIWYMYFDSFKADFIAELACLFFTACNLMIRVFPRTCINWHSHVFSWICKACQT